MLIKQTGRERAFCCVKYIMGSPLGYCCLGELRIILFGHQEALQVKQYPLTLEGAEFIL